MSADAGPGGVEVTVGLAVRRLDHLVDVHAVDVGYLRKLVREGDVEVAVGAFGEFRKLRGLGAGEFEYFSAEDFAVERRSARAACWIDPADDLRVLSQVFDYAAHQ